VLAVLLVPAVWAVWVASSPSSTPVAPPMAASSATTVQQIRRPNMIFILTDDLDTASIPFMPKLKALLADQGATFSNYFVSISLCAPSRASTLRGQYGHNTHIISNDPPKGGYEQFHRLGEEQSTIAVWLQQAGYRTMLAGKYLNHYPDPRHTRYVPPGWNEWYVKVHGRVDHEFDYTLNENGKPVEYGDRPKDYGTDVYVRKTVDFIRRSIRDGRPFFVYLSTHAPHAPATPAPRHAQLFLDRKAPRTPNFNEADVSDKPAYIHHRPPLTRSQINYIDEHNRFRLQSLQAVDDGIEAIVNTLKATNQLDKTYIFFTSDNGFHMGNHRMITGKNVPYNEDLRVPLIVRGPGVPAGITRDQLAGNVDLAPTWAELGGAKAAEFVDGRSLVPLLGDAPPTLDHWRRVFLIEYGINPAIHLIPSTSSPSPHTDSDESPDQDDLLTNFLPFLQRSHLGVPPFFGIRLPAQSYVEYADGEKELYDLKADPYQLRNLAGQAAPGLSASYAEQLNALKTCQAAACRTFEGAPLNLPK
jgi:N-acetylglucosamine-6-sulfatase